MLNWSAALMILLLLLWLTWTKCAKITWKNSLYAAINVTYTPLSVHLICPNAPLPTNSVQPVVTRGKRDYWPQSLGRVNPCDLSSAVKAQHLALWCQMRQQWSISDRWKPLTSVCARSLNPPDHMPVILSLHCFLKKWDKAASDKNNRE